MSSVKTSKNPSNAYKDGVINLRVIIETDFFSENLFLMLILNIITVFIFVMKIPKITYFLIFQSGKFLGNFFFLQKKKQTAS